MTLATLLPFAHLLPEGLLLATPDALWLLALVPVLITARLLRYQEPAARWGAGLYLDGAGRSIRQRLTWMPAALRVLVVVALVGALARPQLGVGEVRTVTNGVAIMGVIDRSFSMTDLMDYDGERLTRLETIKRVFREFVAGTDPESTTENPLAGRPGDMIGLVRFAGIAETACPLVREHDTLLQLADEITIASGNRMDPEAGTAIGEGLALAVARLESAERDLARRGIDDELGAQARDPDFTIRSKVIVLLTDGDETKREFMPQQAADLAAERGITIYTIGIGDATGRYRFRPEVLRSIADTTGGRYFEASNADALREVYAAINELETTEVVSTEFTSREELFQYPLLAAALLLVLEVLARVLLFRRATL